MLWPVDRTQIKTPGMGPGMGAMQMTEVGREAEELRVGIEAIAEELEAEADFEVDPGDIATRLRALLDAVDARDSVRFLAGSGAAAASETPTNPQPDTGHGTREGGE